MKHIPSGTIMAVKRIAATVNTQEQKRLLMDLDISMRSSDCPYTVQFYGALFSGRRFDSVAKTIDAGCKPYMAPERIDPSGNPSQYDIRSDVWSLGISLLELATLKFPYNTWGTPFEQLKQVVKDDPPRLPPNQFSPDFEDFISQCLQKDYTARPNYTQLLQHPFICTHQERTTDVSQFVSEIIDLKDKEKERTV
ncbi:hypothetical protein L9F63_005815 [Diploptera punctata]|uniref:mitogen-activated protein kinase kinase n=1 Tax=Diploptera punctata TaxID=6984 RepID=A0AAD7ZCU6_DIPPU|nr:hypothetical protein L9F63_005815 [Diploptera punctata]